MWIIMAWQCISSLCNCKRYTRYPMHWMELIICCGTAVKRMGMLGVCVGKMKAQTVKMEKLTLIDKGR